MTIYVIVALIFSLCVILLIYAENRKIKAERLGVDNSTLYQDELNRLCASTHLYDRNNEELVYILSEQIEHMEINFTKQNIEIMCLKEKIAELARESVK